MQNAPKKPKEKSIYEIIPAKKINLNADRKKRQFTEVGQLKERLRTKMSIIKLLLSEKKQKKEVIDKKCKRISSLTHGLA